MSSSGNNGRISTFCCKIKKKLHLKYKVVLYAMNCFPHAQTLVQLIINDIINICII